MASVKAFRAPRFCCHDPPMQFTTIESCIKAHRISKCVIRFSRPTSLLPADVLAQVSDVISTVMSKEPYEVLKTAFLSRLEPFNHYKAPRSQRASEAQNARHSSSHFLTWDALSNAEFLVDTAAEVCSVPETKFTLSDTEIGEQHADAHYISANCVVLTYFSGDLATAVDEHFSRALTQSFSKSTKDPCPMSQRNLPASFWNSHYHAGMSGYPTAGSSVTLTGHESLYPDYSSLHGLHQGDPWAYNLTAAGQYGHHRSMADFTQVILHLILKVSP
ncbi:putative protein vestigial [Penaeus vannamei]|uniref:DUF7041 domain-containing protein n=1 Tax=Penaeus vannamei TaxID=6689 RepID=A0A3R7N1H2_PENVA|nr:putative protein vestigial [Penaeus vannamei]